jgi:hypothetical protein
MEFESRIAMAQGSDPDCCDDDCCGGGDCC